MAENAQKRWIPYLITLIGIVVSALVCYVLDQHFEDFFELITRIQIYLPWIGLLGGAFISILMGLLVRMIQVDRHRTVTLNTMNEELKKEIGERMNAEEIKPKLEHALSQGQKLQAMGTLAGGIAHDFNNILYAIIGYIEISREDVDKDSLVYKNLGKVLEASHRGQELISRILAFSRRQQHQFGAIDIRKAIEAALSLLRPTVPASVMIQFHPDTDAQVLGNQTQIHQVLVNLINNAVDAMDGEGTITIQLSDIEADDPFLQQFPGTNRQKYCKIEISDTGHGMDQHTMERSFEPFFTTKEVGKGTGLGLSIVHNIIKDHQGEITIQSQLGRGTTFMILLPETATP